MASAPLLDDAQSATNDIAVVVAQNPTLVLVDAGKRDDLFAHIQREIDAFEPDLSTAKGRDAIKSFAYKITRTKTAIDDAGKKLNEEARAKINVVDAARRDARDKLDAMSKAVRQPLTDWEEAENQRIAMCRDTIARLKQAATVTIVDTVATVRERGTEVFQTELSEDVYRDLLPEAQAAKETTIATLREALARLTREEEERAELEKLRAEKEERDRAEAERLAEEQRKADEIEAQRIAEERRAAAEKAEQERIQQAKDEAAETARREAQAEADRKFAAEREAREAAEAEARRVVEEQERRDREERDRIAAEQAEQAKRDADQKHRTAIKTKVKQALMTCGADEETARKIVLALQAGEIPNVTLRF